MPQRIWRLDQHRTVGGIFLPSELAQSYSGEFPVADPPRHDRPTFTAAKDRAATVENDKVVSLLEDATHLCQIDDAISRMRYRCIR